MTDPYSQTFISAPPQQVWDVLTDWPSFPSWNPFIRRAEGALAVGNRVRIVLRLGPSLMRLRPTITRVEPPRRLRWRARLALPGLYDVERRFDLDARDGGTLLTQSETPSGLVAPLLGPLLRAPIETGYHALESALKARVEGSPPPTESEPTMPAHPHAFTGPAAWKTRINSHETFTHDSIDSLGYDWSRIGNPTVTPRYPRKVYLPQSDEDVVAAVRECRDLGQPLAVRSKGHSSNDLVLTDGALLVTEKLNKVLAVDQDALTATVQAGAVSAQVDDHLATMGLGLPIIGDHNHITVGGFASVGGISPASHRFGLFVDNVLSLEYVTWDGELVACSPEDRPADFYRVLTGMGRHGIMTRLTLRIIRVDKYGTVLRNHERHFASLDSFIKGSAEAIRNPGEALMERGVFVDLPVLGGPHIVLGQFSAYHATEQTRFAKLSDQIAYDALDGLGYVAGRLPKPIDRAMKYVGMAGIMFSPLYASMKNVEFFTDKILDSTVGDPTRMFVVLAPVDAYEELFRASYALMKEFRDQHRCFTFISAYVKSIRSTYLAQGTSNNRFCELMFYCGMAEGSRDPATLEDLVGRLDDIVIAHAGFRYMHSLTSKDPARREKVDPNMHYVRAAEMEATGDAS